VEAVYLSEGCTEAWSPKALRGGQGAQFTLPIVEREDLVVFASNYAGQVLATTLRGDSIFKMDLTGPTAIVIGNEGNGLSSAMQKAASHHVTIPIAEGIESLNAACKRLPFVYLSGYGRCFN
jgi:TrmH family RNA methyltransferase